eukprot:gnl/Spiro4/5226_TR2636_c0_g1_i1.p1 gnl/Spiro4/5226_TR2636_c0_g1~~gnl/Spiro4/5226_TR2636_c0_g1_i1.p1  ORF type:complete len:553 (+),score=163.42 gnl/Spiro4/5226_TR2636_c0_g1_i1:128-1660(+)
MGCSESKANSDLMGSSDYDGFHVEADFDRPFRRMQDWRADVDVPRGKRQVRARDVMSIKCPVPSAPLTENELAQLKLINEPDLQAPCTPQEQEMLNALIRKHDIRPQLLPALRKLVEFDVILVCDDSGSMLDAADPDTPQSLTRWGELKKSVALIIESHAAIGHPIEAIYFLNQGFINNVSSWAQVQPYFDRDPAGGTNLVQTLTAVWAQHVTPARTRPLLVHIFTDGTPTNAQGLEDEVGLVLWLSNRAQIRTTFISFILCTDDEDTDATYRPFEYRVQEQLGWSGPTCGIINVDVTEDYRGELVDVRRLRGPDYHFSFGDYVVKCLVGSFDPWVHQIDLPAGVSVYSGPRWARGAATATRSDDRARNRSALMDGRLSAKGAAAGEIVISLMWHTRDDLDLHVICPCGSHIHFSDKICDRCKGELDVDCRQEDEPVENIYFNSAKPGKYEVFVRNYTNFTRSACVPFDVRITVRNQPQLCRQFCEKNPWGDRSSDSAARQLGCSFMFLN